jgi:hypothetical protein
MPRKKDIPPAQLAEASRLCEQPVARVNDSDPAGQPRADVAAGSDPVSPRQRAAIAQRIMGAVERELNAIERVLDRVAAADQTEAEQGARTLASISRSLREINALNQPDEATTPDEAEHDPVPRDIDEFRLELARRIRGFIEARRIGAGRLPDDPGAALG